MALLFMDIDGVLAPFGRKAPDVYDLVEDIPWHGVTQLSSAHGDWLYAMLAYGHDVVWASSWRDDANTYIAPALGIPELDVSRWDGDCPEGVSHKTIAVVEYAAGRPFVWCDDDDVTPTDESYIRDHHAGDYLLVRTDPAVGLTAEQMATSGRWLSATGVSSSLVVG